MAGLYINKEYYLRNDAGSSKGEDRILHPSIREARRQYQDVVLAPDVRKDHFLKLTSQHQFIQPRQLLAAYVDCLYKFLCVGFKFPPTFV